MRGTALLLAAAICAAPAAAAASGVAGCADILPAERGSAPPRALLPEDLVRLRDIGPAEQSGRSSPLFALSRDGRKAAFQLRRANPATNSYCLAMVVVDVVPGAVPKVVDTGGDILLLTIDIRGKAEFPTGIPLSITPRWSPDGRWIAFLKREGGKTQVWRAFADGSGSGAVTHADADVVDFRIAAGGTTIVYATRPAIEGARAAAAKEALSGYHYDDRFAPVASNRPFPLPPAPREAAVVELATGAVRGASAGEAALIGASIFEDQTQDLHRGRAAGEDVWIDSERLIGGAAPGAFHAVRHDGTIVTCGAAPCTGAADGFLMPDGERVRFFRREGWGDASFAIYEWNPATGGVRQLYVTEDILLDCAPSSDTLICLREASTQPRRLERLDPVSSKRELLFDPNPEFASLRLGRVERLHWRNRFGLQVLGDLVWPVGAEQGRRYPLIVVQYDTRGFLRGGTGDDYPIQALANRGYAILSIRRPLDVGYLKSARSYSDVNRLNLAGFADMRSALSAIGTGVRMAIARGVADPAKLGITGLSDGATQAVFALLHSKLFSAAALSSCCYDTTQSMRIGPAAARDFHAMGFPRMADRDFAFWSHISLSLNARRMKTPLLLQLSDDEMLSGLETYTVLSEVGAPVDMFVFPDEHHVKWQPAHRLATYRRAIDWFDYWLLDKRSTAPDRQAELRHWDALRAQQVSRRRP
jgi:hypothetical protein